MNTPNTSEVTIGLDPGLGRTGWGIVKSIRSRPTVIAYGCIETPSDLSLPARLLFLFRKLNALLEEYKPGVAAVEQLFFNTNVNTALSVGSAKGVILLALARLDVEIHEFTPLEIKQAITGYGRATKLQMQRMVKSLLKMKKLPQPDDAADGLAAALTYIGSSKFRSMVY